MLQWAKPFGKRSTKLQSCADGARSSYARHLRSIWASHAHPDLKATRVWRTVRVGMCLNKPARVALSFHALTNWLPQVLQQHPQVLVLSLRSLNRCLLWKEHWEILSNKVIFSTVIFSTAALNEVQRWRAPENVRHISSSRMTTCRSSWRQHGRPAPQGRCTPRCHAECQ